MKTIEMAAATSRGPVFTYAVFLHPAALSSRRCHHAACYLSPGCHRQYRHICWSWYECSEKQVLFKERRSKNRVGQQHSAVEGDTTEGNGQTVWQKCFFWTETSKFSSLLNMILSGRYVRLYYTSNRLSNRAFCVKEFVIRCHYSGYCQQVTVSRLLSLVHSQQFTVIRLLSTGYCH